MEIEITIVDKLLSDMGVNVSTLSNKRKVEIYKSLITEDKTFKMKNYEYFREKSGRKLLHKVRKLSTGKVFELNLDHKKVYSFYEILEKILQDKNVGFVGVNDFYISYTLLTVENNLEEGYIILKDGEQYYFIGDNIKDAIESV
jgi:stage III sporulation protein SpoIIIAA